MKLKYLAGLLLAIAAILALVRWSAWTVAPQPNPEPTRTPATQESRDTAPALENASRQEAQPSTSAAATGLHGTLQALASPGASARLVPGARVRWLCDGVSLAMTISDADGRYSLPLDAFFTLSELQRERAQLQLEVRATGFQPLLRSTPKPQLATQALLLDCTLLPGNALRSRTLDNARRPVPGATVQLLVSTQKAGKPVLEPIETVRSAADGSFELGFASSARMTVYARAEGIGTAWQEVDLAAGSDFGADDMILRGEGELSGTAQFSDGTPVADLDLWAVPEAVAVQPNALILCVERAPEFERGSGLFSTRCVTSSDGSFRLSGLIPGKYMLRTPTTEVVFEPRFGYYNSGTHGIQISVETQRLRIEVRDAAGMPVVGAQAMLSELNDAGDGRFESGQRWFQRTRGASANASFNVQSETTYGLRVQAPGYDPFEELFLLAPDEFEQFHTITLQPAAPRARVRLVLASPLGTVQGARVHLLSALTGAPDLDLGLLSLDPQGWIEGLPAGDLRFEIGFADSQEAPNWHLPVARTEPVQVPAGGQRELLQDLALGARLEVELTYEGADPSAAAAAAAREERLANWGAFVSFEPEGRPEFVLNFFGPGGRVESQLLPGAAGRGVELIVPTKGVLKVQAPGCYLASEPVMLQPGKYTRVSVRLRARS